MSRPVILEQNHIGNADMFPNIQEKFKISLNFRVGG